MITDRPIIHIGYHKTASTWWQKQFWPRLESHRIVRRRLIREALLAPPGMLFDLATAQSMLDQPGDDRPLVLSEENLSGYIHNNGLHGLMGSEVARRLHMVLPHARIVIFIRAQPDIIRASYIQYVRSGGTKTFRRYVCACEGQIGALRHPFKAPSFGFTHFRFLELIRVYQDAFGTDNVFVYPFESFRDNPARLAAQMMSDLGLKVTGQLDFARAENQSWDRRTVMLARVINRFTRRSVVDKHYLFDIPRLYDTSRRWLDQLDTIWKGRRPVGFPDGMKERIGCEFKDSNMELALLLGLPLEQWGYPLTG